MPPRLRLSGYRARRQSSLRTVFVSSLLLLGLFLADLGGDQVARGVRVQLHRQRVGVLLVADRHHHPVHPRLHLRPDQAPTAAPAAGPLAARRRAGQVPLQPVQTGRGRRVRERPHRPAGHVHHLHRHLVRLLGQQVLDRRPAGRVLADELPVGDRVRRLAAAPRSSTAPPAPGRRASPSPSAPPASSAGSRSRRSPTRCGRGSPPPARRPPSAGRTRGPPPSAGCRRACVQLAPRLADTQAPNSVPTYRTSGLTMSSRRQRVEPNAGRFAVIDFQVAPKSSVTKTYGLSSLDRWASRTT